MAQEIKKINGVYMGSQEIASTRFAALTTNKAYYRFEAGALTTDSSGGGHTLTAISDPAEVAGKFGGAVDLDGNDAYSATDHADFKPTGVFSVSMWFKSSNTAGYQVPIQSWSANTAYAGFQIYTSVTNGYLVFQTGRNTGTTAGTDIQSCTASLNVCDGVWHLITTVWDGSFLKVYVDGHLKNSVAWANAPGYSATNYVRVGCGNDSGTNQYFLTGYLDDLLLLKGTALTSDEITSLYKTGVKKLNGMSNIYHELLLDNIYTAYPPKAYYRFESGALTTDSSGNGHTLTAIGDPAEGTGRFGGGVDLDGNDAYSVASSSDFNLTYPISIGAWVKTTGTGVQTIFSRADTTYSATSSPTLYLLCLNGANVLFYRRLTNGSNDANPSLTGTRVVNDGQWHLVVLTLSGTTATIYVDGTLDATGTITGTSISLTTVASIGNYWNGSAGWVGYLTGSLDDLFFLNGTAISAQEISNLYNTNIKKYMGVSNT